jgi:hypothetical protein
MRKNKQWAHIQTTREVIQGQGLQRTQRKVNGCENMRKQENHDKTTKQI